MNIWRDRLNRWLEPIARRSPLSPNAVTLIAFACNVAAAIMLAMASRDLRLAFYALPLLILGGTLDALDGAIARVQKKESRFGDFLDHFLDRVSDAALFTGWAYGAGAHPLLMTAAVAAILLAGYVGTQIEASFGERSYEGAGRAEFLIGVGLMILISYGTLLRQGPAQLVSNALISALVFFVCLTIVKRLFLARRLANQQDSNTPR